MSTIDIFIVIILVIGAFAGYKDGFLMTLFSLLAILLGVLGAFKLMGWAMIFLDDRFDINERVLPYVSFAVVFVVILILVTFLGRMLRLSIDKTFLGKVDQIAGAGLGLLKTGFVLSISFWLLEALDFEFPDRWTHDSWLYGRVQVFAPAVAEWLGDFFPFFDDIF